LIKPKQFVSRSHPILGPVLLAAGLALVVLVMVLGGAKLAQRAVIMMGNLVAATLLAISIWSFMRPT